VARPAALQRRRCDDRPSNRRWIANSVGPSPGGSAALTSGPALLPLRLGGRVFLRIRWICKQRLCRFNSGRSRRVLFCSRRCVGHTSGSVDADVSFACHAADIAAFKPDDLRSSDHREQHLLPGRTSGSICDISVGQSRSQWDVKLVNAGHNPVLLVEGAEVEVITAGVFPSGCFARLSSRA
jgi:hypothetical protein